jgi:hypothetical protein
MERENSSFSVSGAQLDGSTVPKSMLILDLIIQNRERSYWGIQNTCLLLFNAVAQEINHDLNSLNKYQA